MCWIQASHRAWECSRRLQEESRLAGCWLTLGWPGLSLTVPLGRSCREHPCCGDVVGLLGFKGSWYGAVVMVGNLNPSKCTVCRAYLLLCVFSSYIQLSGSRDPRTHGSNQLCFTWIIKINFLCSVTHSLLGQEKYFLQEIFLCSLLWIV